MGRVRLRSGHVQPVWAGHPWVFAQAIEAVDGAPAAGDVVDVVDGRGHFLGRGYWSPHSAIPVRILSRNPDDGLDGPSLARRIEAAAQMRRELMGLPSRETDAYRLVHSEGDGLAGLVVDVYGKAASLQLLTYGMKRREPEILAAVARATGAETLIEMPNAKTSQHEGFSTDGGIVRGPDISGLAFNERGFAFQIPLELTQKTGYYVDQRENRALVEALAPGRRVLDLFSYIGAFSLSAVRGGAERSVAVDSSAPALAAGATLARHHGFGDRIEFRRLDLKRALAELVLTKERFDLVILDPPKLVPTTRHLDPGRKAYRRLNALAMQLLTNGGVLVSCSCSAALRSDDFLRTISIAARDANVTSTLFSLGQQGPDHPVPPAFSEGRYLKTAFVRVQR